MNTMHAFRSLHELLKTIGACSYAVAPDAHHGTTRHLLTFTASNESTIPCLNDSADFAMRYSEARVGWHLSGSIFGHAPEKDSIDPVVFWSEIAVKAEQRVNELRTLLAAIQQTMRYGTKPEFIDWLYDLAKYAPGKVEALKNSKGAIVGGVCEHNSVCAYFSSGGIWNHRMGWYDEPASHAWQINEESLRMMEKRCAEYLADVQTVVREAVEILRGPDTL